MRRGGGRAWEWRSSGSRYGSRGRYSFFLRTLATLLVFFAVGCRAPSRDSPFTHGALGIEAGAMTPAGAPIVAIVAGSPADAAGLREGDLLVEIAGRRITWSCELDALLFDRDGAAAIRVVATRQGETLEKTLTPVDRTSLYAEAC